jgi:hypothetical protein
MTMWLQRGWGLARCLIAWALWLRFGALVALLGFFAYPVLLLPIFVALRWINRGPAQPSWTDLARAWWGEFLATETSFGWQQPWRQHAEPDHLPASATTGVVLVHGFCCNRAFWNPWMARLRAQGVAFVAPTLEPAFGSIDAYADTIEAAVRRVQALTGRSPLIVGHSMGGVAIRAWWRRYARAEAPQVITLGTPHGGTWIARLSFAVNGRQMRSGSAWIQALPPLPRLVCAVSACDQLVMPVALAVQRGAPQQIFDAVGHVALTRDERVWALLQEVLAGSSFSTPRRI